MVGTRRKPLSSRNPKWAPSSAVFFYAGPHMLLPVSYGPFVPLPVAGRGLLARPAHVSHEPPNIRDRVPDPELPVNHIPDPPQGPEIRLETGFQRTRHQEPCQPLSLASIQQGRPTRGRLDPQPLLPSLAIRLSPADDGTQGASDDVKGHVIPQGGSEVFPTLCSLLAVAGWTGYRLCVGLSSVGLSTVDGSVH